MPSVALHMPRSWQQTPRPGQPSGGRAPNTICITPMAAMRLPAITACSPRGCCPGCCWRACCLRSVGAGVRLSVLPLRLHQPHAGWHMRHAAHRCLPETSDGEPHPSAGVMLDVLERVDDLLCFAAPRGGDALPCSFDAGADTGVDYTCPVAPADCRRATTAESDCFERWRTERGALRPGSWRTTAGAPVNDTADECVQQGLRLLPLRNQWRAIERHAQGRS